MSEPRTAVRRCSGFARYESAPITTIYFVQDELADLAIIEGRA